jgi:serine protease Do
MNALRWTALAVALLGVTSIGSAQSGGQDRPRTRELTVLAGRGGELGLRIADAKSGVEVERVEPDSAADKAGVKAGDVILEFDGERVRSGRQFARLVQETPAGRTVKATISRNGQRHDLQITTAEGRDSAYLFDGDRFRAQWGDRFGDLDRLRDLPFNFNFDFDIPGMSSGRLGVTVDPLTRQLAEYFGAKEGVLVTSVADGSAASQAGLKAGDVITSVNGSPIHSREDLVQALRQVDGDEVSIGIVRDKKESTMKAKIEAPRRTIRGARPV